MGGDMSKEQISKAVWDLSFHEDAGKRWSLCQSLGKLPEFKDAFGKMHGVRERHVGGAVAAGVGAAFTAGATAGLCASETVKAASCELNFIAYCIKTATDRGMISMPAPTGSKIVDPKSLPEHELWENWCKTLMREEHLAAEYALVKAQYDCHVTKIVSIAVSFGAGGGDLADLGMELGGAPEFLSTLKEIKDNIDDASDLHDSAKSIPDLLRSFIALAMKKRRERLG